MVAVQSQATPCPKRVCAPAPRGPQRAENVMYVMGIVFVVVLALVALALIGLLLMSASDLRRYQRIRKM
jgi:hypothetical protein